MKYQNLTSSILGAEESGRPAYNKDVEKVAFGSNADWKCQASSAKIINKGGKADTFSKKAATAFFPSFRVERLLRVRSHEEEAD